MRRALEAGNGATDSSPGPFVSLVLPARSVLIMVDPARRVVEIVTGGHVRERLTDEETRQVVALMTEHFATDDLATGLTRGIEQLGVLARD